MNRWVIAAVACLAAGAAQATCIYPRAPQHIPDGKTATFDEMLAVKEAVQQFNNDISAYNACLDLEMSALEKSGQYDETRLLELRAMQDKKHNAAIDEVQAVADDFNEQLRIYQARDKEKKKD